jgi:hypothetical protein
MKNHNFKHKLSIEALNLPVLDSKGSCDPRFFTTPSKFKSSYNIIDYVDSNNGFRNRWLSLIDQDILRIKNQLNNKNEDVAASENIKLSSKKAAKHSSLKETAVLQHSILNQLNDLEQAAEQFFKANKNLVAKLKQRTAHSNIKDSYTKQAGALVYKLLLTDQTLESLAKTSHHFKAIQQRFDRVSCKIIQDIKSKQERMGRLVSSQQEDDIHQTIKLFNVVKQLPNQAQARPIYARCLEVLQKFSDTYPWYADVYYYQAEILWELNDKCRAERAFVVFNQFSELRQLPIPSEDIKSFVTKLTNTRLADKDKPSL